MKICVILPIFIAYLSVVTCRPQSVQENFRFEQVDDSVRLPYIGGARGQVLEIRQRPDGTIFSRILMDESKHDAKRDADFDPFQNTKALVELSNQKQENSFESNLASIQQAAADLVTFQDIFKEQGRLTNEQRRKYSQSLEKLGVSAQKLASIQGTDDEIKLLLQEPSSAGDKNKKEKKPENPRFPPYNHKKTEQQKKEEECEESGAVVEEGTNLSTTTSSPKPSQSSTKTSTTTTKKPVVIVTSNLSATSGGNNNVQHDEGDGDEESSVAEAKPVGLAIAGIGGVASSKPSGTAVVGPGGLAVARPVATAIAGLKPGEYAQLGLPLPSKVKNIATSSRGAASLPYRGKYGIVSFGMDDDNEGGRLLVGPEYLSEARLAEKGIESPTYDEEDNFNDKEETNNNNSRERETLKRPVVVEEEKEEEYENNKYFENPYGTAEYGKYPLFPVTQDRFNFLHQNPYFLPPTSSYIPIPLANQYLQRRAFNNAAAYRYPQIISPYGSYGAYGQQENSASPYAPFRVFYAQ